MRLLNFYQGLRAFREQLWLPWRGPWERPVGGHSQASNLMKQRQAREPREWHATCRTGRARARSPICTLCIHALSTGGRDSRLQPEVVNNLRTSMIRRTLTKLRSHTALEGSAAPDPLPSGRSPWATLLWNEEEKEGMQARLLHFCQCG